MALVGYTNAGKSSLMRALTGSEVLVADQLFATLDTTVRALQPGDPARACWSRTRSGSSRSCPTTWWRPSARRSTRRSRPRCCSTSSTPRDPTCEAQLEVTREVLRDIGADEVPSLLLLNKADRLDEAARRALRERYPGAILLSAHAPEDVAALRRSVLDFFEAQMVEAELLIPYASQGRLGEVYESARVLSETFDEAGRSVRVRSTPAAIAKLTRLFQA